MKNRYSLWACLTIAIVLLVFRGINPGINGDRPLKVTEWDAFGYYVYLPSILIYHDYKDLKWLDSIDHKYGVTGGNGWQAQKEANGNYVFKYLGGVALLELPLFLAGHWIAGFTGAQQDGFSPPYQYALGYGVILYCLLGLIVLRKVLLRYFDDLTVAITLLLLCLATNFIQYAAVDNGQSHAYIFPLYALLLYATWQWHAKPRPGFAALIGYIIGLAAISRPTESIMLLVPLLWGTQDKDSASRKWGTVKRHRLHIAIAAMASLIGVLPQLIYWKSASGSIVYDVGSKWDFLNPHFRVLFGPEKGWFVYTPVTLLFVSGLFFVRKFPFRKSVLWFCLLNIYIIIAWSVWRYGGSYSTRALVQSYPVFALPLAAIVERSLQLRWKYLLGLFAGYLVFLNLFQIIQYDKTILHYDEMNFAYYRHIYLNMHPSPLEMSLMDTQDFLSSESGFNQKPQTSLANLNISFDANKDTVLTRLPLAVQRETWYRVNCAIKAPGCLWSSYVTGELKKGDSVKAVRIRLFQAISKDNQTNRYEFYMRISEYFNQGVLSVKLSSANPFRGSVEKLDIIRLTRK